MLSIELSDVIGVLESCQTQLTVIIVALVAMVIAMIACFRMKRHTKFMIRTQAAVVAVLVLAICVNAICFGPMSTLISLATGNGVITEETQVEASSLVEQIADEGIVLLENEAGALPLAQNTRLNVFGWASTNPCYGGTGSGALNDAYPITSLYDGLQNAGFTLNTELRDFYTAYRADRPTVGMSTQDWTLPEPPASTYTQEMMDHAKGFSDTALVVITRVGGEGADLPGNMAAVMDGSYNDGSRHRASSFTNNSEDYDDFSAGQHYLELSQSERGMLDLVCANFEDVIVVYNGANAMELGFIEEYPQIKGAVWCAGTGQNGFNSLGKILCGQVNPSGKTVDTFVYDLTAAPYFNNLIATDYSNLDEYAGDSSTFYPDGFLPKFIDYVEGIYVGYRFYETAAVEGLINYKNTVQYPFGYGLSYTSFTQKMGPLSVDTDGNLSFDVVVTNTGSTAGKDVVEVYYNPPYINGGIEKSVANLVTFDKTDLLAPGASQTLTIRFSAEDMASYDAQNAGCYVLEAGDYIISINRDAHTALDSAVYTVASNIVYQDGRASDAAPAKNQFDFAKGELTYLSRADGFANYAEATAAPVTNVMPESAKAGFDNNKTYDPSAHNDPNAVMPTTGVKGTLKLEALRGLDYDDPMWDTLLDQMTVAEMIDLCALGGYQTAAIDSIGKVRTNDCDGPASINNNFTGTGSLGFPSGVMIAATFNTDLATAFGEGIGKMADEMDVSGWYAPAMNTHRTAFGGRNFEYYSEDGVLAGLIAAYAIQGAHEYGVYAYIKHFALNDCEDQRLGMLCTWANEQSIREVYLKPFELAVKVGGAEGVMSAFNYIGNKWAGGSVELLTNVLRNEWGFKGMILTDAFGRNGRSYLDVDQLLRAGADFCLINYDGVDNYPNDSTSATAVSAMRAAAHNILYVVVNSRAYTAENAHAAMPTWKVTAVVVDVIIVLLLAAFELLVVRRKYAARKAADALVVQQAQK